MQMYEVRYLNGYQRSVLNRAEMTSNDSDAVACIIFLHGFWQILIAKNHKPLFKQNLLCKVQKSTDIFCEGPLTV